MVSRVCEIVFFLHSFPLALLAGKVHSPGMANETTNRTGNEVSGTADTMLAPVTDSSSTSSVSNDDLSIAWDDDSVTVESCGFTFTPHTIPVRLSIREQLIAELGVDAVDAL